MQKASVSLDSEKLTRSGRDTEWRSSLAIDKEMSHGQDHKRQKTIRLYLFDVREGGKEPFPLVFACQGRAGIYV
jgi:hypothetical protein